MRNGYFGLGLTLLIILGVMLLFQLLGSIGVLVAYGMNEENWDPQGVLVINSISQLVTMGGGAWLVTVSAKQNPTNVFRLDQQQSRASLPVYVLILPLTLVAQGFGSALASIWMNILSVSPELFAALHKIQDLLDTTMRKLAIANSPSDLVIGLIAIALVPAICEELFFRGFALTNIERSGTDTPRHTLAIVSTGLAFGLAHLSPFNFPAIVSLGLIFGWLLVKTNDIRTTMATHFLNNAIIVFALYALGNNEELTDALLSSEALPLLDSIIIAGISGILLVGLLVLIGRLTVKPPTTLYEATNEHSNLTP